MNYLFDAWPELRKACLSDSHILFLADYDGTLTPMFNRPEDALLSADMRQRLKQLAEKPRFSLGIISGRSLEEIRTMVGIPYLYYAGNHGLEINGPGLDYIHPEAEKAIPAIDEMTKVLHEKLSHFVGIIIQGKKYSLSVHYRMVEPENEAIVEKIVKETVEPYIKQGYVRLFPGKKVWELYPTIDWDKGKAIEVIHNHLDMKVGKSDIVTLFLGDDTTDENGFRVVRPPDGWSIYVGHHNTQSAATYYLHDVKEVGILIEQLVELSR